MDLLIPSTFGADERDDKLRTVKFGILARAASIYGFERIIIYKDSDPKINEKRNAELLEKYLNYAECPPYLRKELIPHDEDLKYANIMPALQIISHGYSERFREGVIKENEKGEVRIKAGLDEDLTSYGDLEEGERVTVKVLEGNEAQVIDQDSLTGFWTFEVENRDENLGKVIEDVDKPVIATSAHGEPVKDYKEDLNEEEDLAVVFGSAWRGIPSMIERGDLEEDKLDYMLNFVPEQETKTVRTEEALYICLGILDFIIS